MSSMAYTALMGLFLIVFAGIVYTIMDQVNMGNFLTFAEQQKLNGTYMNWYVWLWALIPIAITFHFIAGSYAHSHFSRNELD